MPDELAQGDSLRERSPGAGVSAPGGSPAGDGGTARPSQPVVDAERPADRPGWGAHSTQGAACVGEIVEHPWAEFGQFMFTCEVGHNIRTTEPDLDFCPAVVPWPRTPESRLCGAEIEYRRIPYTPLSGGPAEGDGMGDPIKRERQ